MHNLLCDGRSSWEIMREHEDFRDGWCKFTHPQLNRRADTITKISIYLRNQPYSVETTD